MKKLIFPFFLLLELSVHAQSRNDKELRVYITTELQHKEIFYSKSITNDSLKIVALEQKVIELNNDLEKMTENRNMYRKDRDRIAKATIDSMKYLQIEYEKITKKK